MFDIFNSNHVEENPILAEKFIQYVLPTELMQYAISHPSPNIFSLKPIVNGILSSDNEGLKLVLAACGDFFDDSEFAIEKLHSISDATKAALYSNSSINWYHFNVFNKEFKNSYFTQDFFKDDGLSSVLLRNPRMDRGLIADVIRGRGVYEGLNIDVRIRCLYLSVDVNEIESEHWDGKDMPDDNELDFDKPIKSFLPLMREALSDSNSQIAQQFCNSFLWKLDQIELDYDDRDWVESSYDVNANSLQRMDSMFADRKNALTKIFEFLDSVTAEIAYEIPEEGRNRVSILLTLSIVRSLSKSYRFQKCIEDNPAFSLEHSNWIIRASYYNYLFERIQFGNDQKELEVFLKYYEKNPLEVLLGISFGYHLALWREYTHFEDFVLDPLNESEYIDEIESLHNDYLKYLFPVDAIIRSKYLPKIEE